MTPSEIVAAYVDRINTHDVDGVCALTERNGVFIDGLGHALTGREAIRKAWRSYFAMIPDYWVKVERQLQQGKVVAVFGRAGGTLATADGRLDAANRWEVPAAWQAVVGKKGIAVWQVYADNEPIRQIMAKQA
jgi:ketosteroid isomerase-like protein